jgi:hypothetical protein
MSSHLKHFIDLIELRSRPSFQWGKRKLVLVNKNVFSFVRTSYIHPTFLVIMNLTDATVSENLMINNDIAPRAYVTYYMPGNIDSIEDDKNSIDLNEKYKLNEPVLTKKILLKPRDCLILTWFSVD